MITKKVAVQNTQDKSSEPAGGLAIRRQILAKQAEFKALSINLSSAG
jgi:hypothetical protein